MTPIPKFGCAHHSGTGGEGAPLHTLDDYLKAQVLLEMDKAGVPANESYKEDEFKRLVKKLKEDLEGTVDLENDPSRDTYVKNYCWEYGLEKLKL